jgi:hypothetical protein
VGSAHHGALPAAFEGQEAHSMKRLLLMLSLFVSIPTTVCAQERAPRREGPPRAEARERLREAAERMPHLRERLEALRERLQERRGELRERLRESHRRPGRPEGRGQESRSERRPGLRGEGPRHRPHLPPQLRERIREHLRAAAGPRQRGERMEHRPPTERGGRRTPPPPRPRRDRNDV